MTRDFTQDKLKEILIALMGSGYTFQTFGDFIAFPGERTVILRHDVDRLPENSLETAKMEQTLGIVGSYYFRIVKGSYDPGVIVGIGKLGHEIGYHYEDLTLTSGNNERAIKSFINNLEKLRQFFPVKTICMHGSPSSGLDNRDIWKTYNYKNYGITGEPYFDLDFEKVLYLTDTGRRWDGEKWSVRDKVRQDKFKLLKEGIKTSDDLIIAARNNLLPDVIMITIHPQRWDNNFLKWMVEAVVQKIKNSIKRLLFVKH